MNDNDLRFGKIDITFSVIYLENLFAKFVFGKKKPYFTIYLYKTKRGPDAHTDSLADLISYEGASFPMSKISQR